MYDYRADTISGACCAESYNEILRRLMVRLTRLPPNGQLPVILPSFHHHRGVSAWWVLFVHGFGGIYMAQSVIPLPRFL